MSTNAPASAPASALDWVLAPTPRDKIAGCGKVTQITEFSNGTVGVMTFYCHRWDCEHCRQVSKRMVIDKVLKKSVLWYAIPINSSKYDATRKRIVRADAKYVAIGSGDEILMLTDKPVLEDCKLLSKVHLEPLIDRYLEAESQYDYRHRRFRHSAGLFSAAQPTTNSTHIKRKVAVDRSKKDVISGLENKGYASTTHTGGVDYMRPYKAHSSLDSALKDDVNKIKWLE